METFTITAETNSFENPFILNSDFDAQGLMTGKTEDVYSINLNKQYAKIGEVYEWEHEEQFSANTLGRYLTNITAITNGYCTNTDGYAMFSNKSNLQIVSVDFSHIERGEEMFAYCRSMKEFNNNTFTNLTNARSMFNGCSGLTKIECAFPSMEEAYHLCYECYSLKNFNVDSLPVSTHSNEMFWKCSSLTEFHTELPNLLGSDALWGNCTSLSSFTTDLSHCTALVNAFFNCTSLSSFTGNLNSLKNGKCMFMQSGLKSFSTPLPNILTAQSMFQYCTNLEEVTTDFSHATSLFCLFDGCTNLKKVTSSFNPTYSPSFVFNNCTSLSELNPLSCCTLDLRSCPIDATKSFVDIQRCGTITLLKSNIQGTETEIDAMVARVRNAGGNVVITTSTM